MCEVRQRRWREAFRPLRVALGLAAIGCVLVGARYASVFGLGLIGLGAALLLAAVVLPTVREVEFGLPVGVKVTAAVRQREEELHDAFETQKGDFELYSQLLCGQQEDAAQLLGAAWSRTVTAWRGPVTPDLRYYVLCVLVQLVKAREKWVDPGPVASAGASALAALPLDRRVVIVLHDFAGLPLARIGAMTGRSVQSVENDIRTAEETLKRPVSPGSGP
jgi:hypothetical protein